MTQTFRAPRTFDPSYSLLGRAFRRWTNDRLRGEALFLLALTGLTLALVLAHYLSWALLHTLTAADPSGQWRIFFWIGQVASVLLLVGLGGIGFKPEVVVTIHADDATLHLRQGTRERRLPLNTVDTITRISARRFHRHERRYAATDVFAARLGDEVLRLDTPHGPLVVGLPAEDDLDTLYALLTSADHGKPVAVQES